jgi:hypothetical protein
VRLGLTHRAHMVPVHAAAGVVLEERNLAPVLIRLALKGVVLQVQQGSVVGSVLGWASCQVAAEGRGSPLCCQASMAKQRLCIKILLAGGG